jgi:uncharacterized protein (TIGR03435 family)
MHTLKILALASFSCALAGAQTFALADVHVSPPSKGNNVRGGFLAGRYELKNATMMDLIQTAWGVESDVVFGGPTWLENDRFDIIAKAPADSTDADRALMLRALLAERFGLVTHSDNKSLPVFALTQTKRGAQLKQAEETGKSDCQSDGQEGPPLEVAVTCHNVTMTEFAAQVRNRDRSSVNHPVVDLTTLKGAWDFSFKYAPLVWIQRAKANGQPASISLFEALDKLGLHLEAQTRMYPVIAVDKVNRTPTENAPNITKNLPPAPSEFEVADIKPSRPGTKPDVNFRPGGRLDVQGLTLKNLIGAIWDVDDNMIAGGPKWLDSDHYDIVAKAPEGAPEDTLKVMARALLIERFKLATHNEDRPVPVYALVAGKSPKLKEGDPTARSGCKMSIGQTGSGAGTIPLRICTCQNTTMAQFAEFIRPNAAAYLDHPVVDLTGLKGSYDFVVNWTGKGMLKAGQGRGGDDGGATDPSGALTVFEAVDRQLGLKLESRKHPLPVLVVDHAEQITPDK